MNNYIEVLLYYLGVFVDELMCLDVCDVVISLGLWLMLIVLLME